MRARSASSVPSVRNDSATPHAHSKRSVQRSRSIGPRQPAARCSSATWTATTPRSRPPRPTSSSPCSAPKALARSVPRAVRARYAKRGPCRTPRRSGRRARRIRCAPQTPPCVRARRPRSRRCRRIGRAGRPLRRRDRSAGSRRRAHSGALNIARRSASAIDRPELLAPRAAGDAAMAAGDRATALDAFQRALAYAPSSPT